VAVRSRGDVAWTSRRVSPLVPSGDADHPRLFVLPGTGARPDRVFVVWSAVTHRGASVVLRTSLDGGGRWKPSTVLAPTAARGLAPAVGVTIRGRAYAGFASEGAVELATPGIPPATIATGMISYYSRCAGAVPIPMQNARCVPLAPAVVAVHTLTGDRVALAYIEEFGRGRLRVRVTVTDRGRQRVVYTSAGGGDQFMPALAFDQVTRTLVLCYYKTATNRRSARFTCAASRSFGNRWG